VTVLLDPAQHGQPGYDQARDALDNYAIGLLLAFSLREDSNCIDVGAHGGAVLRDIRRHAPAGRHIAYEPLPHLARQLELDFPQVEVRNKALSDRREQTTFNFVRSAPAFSGIGLRAHLEEHQVEQIPVELEDLDSSLPEDYAPDFLKVDVEGAEVQVFRGALRAICEHRPTIVFEHGQGGADQYGTGPDDVWDLLAGEARLRIFDLDGGAYRSKAEFAESFERGARWQYVARP
jgi:FkbM family methyltransferase